MDGEGKENIAPLGMIPIPPETHWLSWRAEWDMFVPRHTVVGERQPLYDLMTAGAGSSEVAPDVEEFSPAVTVFEGTPKASPELHMIVSYQTHLVVIISQAPEEGLHKFLNDKLMSCHTYTLKNQTVVAAQSDAAKNEQDFFSAIHDAASTFHLWT